MIIGGKDIPIEGQVDSFVPEAVADSHARGTSVVEEVAGVDGSGMAIGVSEAGHTRGIEMAEEVMSHGTGSMQVVEKDTATEEVGARGTVTKEVGVSGKHARQGPKEADSFGTGSFGSCSVLADWVGAADKRKTKACSHKTTVLAELGVPDAVVVKRGMMTAWTDTPKECCRDCCMEKTVSAEVEESQELTHAGAEVGKLTPRRSTAWAGVKQGMVMTPKIRGGFHRDSFQRVGSRAREQQVTDQSVVVETIQVAALFRSRTPFDFVLRLDSTQSS